MKIHDFDLLEYKEAVTILEGFASGITKPPGIFAMKARSLKELSEYPEANLTLDKVQAIV